MCGKLRHVLHWSALSTYVPVLCVLQLVLPRKDPAHIKFKIHARLTLLGFSSTIFYIKKSTSFALGVFMCFAWWPPPKSHYACTPVFSTFLLVAPLWAWFICVPHPPSLVYTVPYGRKLLHCQIVDLYIRLYIMFVYNIVLFLKNVM